MTTRTPIRLLLAGQLLSVMLMLGACSEVTTVALQVETVEIQGGGNSILVDGITQLNAVAKSGRFTLSGRTPVWSTSNHAIAEVDASGLVTGKAAGTVEITATIEQKSQSRALEVRNPAPTLTSLSHPTVPVGSAAFTLTISGTGFVPTTLLRVDNDRYVGLSVHYVGPTQLTLTVPASLLTAPDSVEITAFNTGPGGGESNALRFTVGAPAPTLTSIDPQAVLAGSPTFTLTVNGANFVSGTVARVDGSNVPTTYVNATRLTATIAAHYLEAPGQLEITVGNPGPGGGNSPPLVLSVLNPIPEIAAITPAMFPDADGRRVRVHGSNFVPSSVVRWNGLNRMTTYVGPSELIVLLDPADIANAGVGAITVFNHAPGGGSSSAANFSVSCPAPTMTFPLNLNSSISPSACVGVFGQLFNLYRFTITNAGTTTLTMQSSQFIPALELYDGDFLDGNGFLAPIAWDDNGLGGPTAQIVHHLSPGEYYVAAFATPAGQTGSYTLTLSAGGADVAVEVSPLRAEPTESGIGAAIRGGAVSNR